MPIVTLEAVARVIIRVMESAEQQVILDTETNIEYLYQERIRSMAVRLDVDQVRSRKSEGFGTTTSKR